MSYAIHSFSSARAAVPYNITSFSEEAGKASAAKEPSAPVFPEPVCLSICDRHKVLICYTPINACDVASCVYQRNTDPLVFTTDTRAAMIPAGAIIDSVEFFGVDDFITKGVFSIGLGQLNQNLSFPLIVESNITISNERVGGCRSFLTTSPDGYNEKTIVLCDSNVNVEFTNPVSSGFLQIMIQYHMKML